MNFEGDVVVKSWSELCDRLYDNAWQPDLNRYRTDYAFRGVSDKAFSLANRFQRNSGERAELEYHLLRNFRKYAQIEDKQLLTSEWRTLTLGQHYGLPTRLLDWTYSPFVAVHFATANITHYDRDGVIWKVDFKKVNHLLPNPLRDVLLEVGSNTFTIEMLESAVPTLKDYDVLGKQHEQVLFFEPPSIDARIINQFAFFSVMTGPTQSMDTWLANHPEVWRRIIIPKELKWEVRDKLDQANITERLLFPGLDGLAAWLQRHYIPNV